MKINKKNIYLNVEKNFRDYMISKSFNEIDGTNIFPDSDTNTLFNISGMSPLRKYFTNEKVPKFHRLFSIQECIRLDDIENVGDEDHLTSFRMLGIFIFDNFEKKYLFRLVIDFLFSLGFKEKNLIISVNNEETTIYEYIRNNFNFRKLYYDKNNIWYTKKNDIAGTCVEIFIEHKNKIIEIANIVFTCGYYDDKFIKKDFLYADVGIGCERIEMIINNLKNIYSIFRYRKIFNYFCAKDVKLKDSKILTDHIKTFDLLTKNFIFPDHKNREYVCKKILRRILRIINKYREKKLFLESIINFCQLKNKELLRYIISNEYFKINRSKVMATKFINKKSNNFIIEEDARFCLETIGISKEELEDIALKSNKIIQLDVVNKKQKEYVKNVERDIINLSDFFLGKEVFFFDNIIQKNNHINTKIIDKFSIDSKTYIHIKNNITLPNMFYIQNKVKFILNNEVFLKKNDIEYKVKQVLLLRNKKSVLCYEIIENNNNIQVNDDVEIYYKNDLQSLEEKILGVSVLINSLKKFDPNIIIKNIIISNTVKMLFFSSSSLSEIKNKLILETEKTINNIKGNIKIEKNNLINYSKKTRENFFLLDTILSDIVTLYKTNETFFEQLICYINIENMNNLSIDIKELLVKDGIVNELEFSVFDSYQKNEIKNKRYLINKIYDILSLEEQTNLIKEIEDIKESLRINKLHTRNLAKFLIEKMLHKEKDNYFIFMNKELFCYLTDIEIPRNVIILYFSRIEKKYYCITTSEKNTEIKKKLKNKAYLGEIKLIFKNDKNLSFSAQEDIIKDLEYNDSIYIDLRI